MSGAGKSLTLVLLPCLQREYGNIEEQRVVI